MLFIVNQTLLSYAAEKMKEGTTECGSLNLPAQGLADVLTLMCACLTPSLKQVGEIASIESGEALVCDGAHGVQFDFAVSGCEVLSQSGERGPRP